MRRDHCVVRSFFRAALLTAATLAVIAEEAPAQTSSTGGISLPTMVRVQAPGWWPTKGDPARNEYVGAAECAKCHASKAAHWQTTAMAHAATRAADSDSLRRHIHLGSQIGPFSYEIATDDEKSVLEVSNANSSSSQVLLWAFGVGRMGQTYLYENKGVFYESHLSFFTTPQTLDITPGQPRSMPTALDQAAGRRMTLEETQRCFGCHTTASTTKDQFDPKGLFLGVTCEACHGPGAKHIAAVKSGATNLITESILNPRRLNLVDSVDFCGACHRTWEDVVANGFTGVGVFNVRFAPYRLENSRCWKKGDARITCIACHDPHQPLVQDPQSYDLNCLQCHAVRAGIKRTSDHPGGTCPAGTKNCVTCHMPKYEPPDLHSAFTDHWIRIVRPGKAYPN